MHTSAVTFDCPLGYRHKSKPQDKLPEAWHVLSAHLLCGQERKVLAVGARCAQEQVGQPVTKGFIWHCIQTGKGSLLQIEPLFQDPAEQDHKAGAESSSRTQNRAYF